ncbi:MAG: lysophospholipid acyltransferase family protein [Pirellulales bacterium]|jgi:KDO2-lipid IV(A) lauroyltransferase|nr:lysophospholipid acyltransferase family protein [Pirellulales bacterium]
MTRTLRQRALDRTVYIAVRVVICVIQAIPRPTSERLARSLSVILANRLRIRRKVVRTNLHNAFPDWTVDQIRETARGMWEHLLLMVIEIAHANRVLRMTTWRRHLQIVGMEQVVRTMWSDRPKVVLSGHYGNFELAAYLFGVFGFRTFSVARELDNPLLDRFVTEFRESRGQKILPKKGSAPDVSLVLEEKGALGLLGDQAAGPRSSWVNFFGRPVSVHKAIAVFALTSEAPVMVFTATRRGGLFSFDVRLEGLVDPADDTPETADNHALSQWYTSLLEGAIRRVPAQYWWVHNRWRGAPPKVTKRHQAA